ncbi:MAG: hypothetical protein E6K53_05705 [Gammaproteobacteria bacterium]|nr:MAG: hypothetical protein E6K53_05705 [Gammaproteobacteria bacterium]
MCKTLIFGLLAGLSNLAAADTVYYLDLINTAASNVVSFEVALPGSELFRSVLPGGAPLHGGGESATVTIHKGEDGCLRDLRIGFADGHVLMHRDFNICRGVSYHTERYLRQGILAAKATRP